MNDARNEGYGCNCLCFPRFRGLAVSDGHRGIGLTSVMFSTYFTLMQKLLEGITVAEGTKISTGRMRKPVLCSILKDRWNFVPKSSRFELHMLPSEDSGEKGVRVTGQDIGRIRSCFSNNYCKSQDITIVPYDSSQLEGSKVVYVETEYEADWISLVGMLKERFPSLDSTGTWWGGLGEESKRVMEEEKKRRKEEGLPSWQEAEEAAKAVRDAALDVLTSGLSKSELGVLSKLTKSNEKDTSLSFGTRVKKEVQEFDAVREQLLNQRLVKSPKKKKKKGKKE